MTWTDIMPDGDDNKLCEEPFYMPFTKKIMKGFEWADYIYLKSYILDVIDEINRFLFENLSNNDYMECIKGVAEAAICTKNTNYRGTLREVANLEIFANQVVQEEIRKVPDPDNTRYFWPVREGEMSKHDVLERGPDGRVYFQDPDFFLSHLLNPPDSSGRVFLSPPTIASKASLI
jgi:hypothetical protein